MYIKRIMLENVRCFGEDDSKIDLDLAGPKGAKPCIVLLGDNGTGKTTVLRCIAMGMCDETKASGLLEEQYGEMVRHQAPDGASATIHIEFESANSQAALWSRTEINEPDSGERDLKQKTRPAPFPWEDIFVCGYGANRRILSTGNFSEYGPVEAMYSLFNYGADLFNPELSLRRAKDAEGIELPCLLNKIARILDLPPDSVRLGKGAVEVEGPWGEYMPHTGLGDGYHALLGMVCDLFGWSLLYDSSMLKQEVSGIVLIDELEQHLHPLLQRRIIGLLRRQFPKVQFIITTHSPLCAIGTTDLEDEECALFLLTQEQDHVTASGPHLPPRGQRADQVLTSYLFSLPISGDDTTQEEIERYAQLMGKPRSHEAEEEVRSLREAIERKLGSGETKLEQYVAKAVSKVLAQESDSSHFDTKALDYEIKRQLRKLLE